jgi:hypothetical protein
MRRTDLMDTSPEVHREIVRRLRAMTPAERLRITLNRITLGLAIHETAMKRLGKERKDWIPKRR